MCPVIYFSLVIQVNLKGVQIEKQVVKKNFPILLDMKAKSSTVTVKTMVHRLKITNLGNHLSRMIFIF